MSDSLWPRRLYPGSSVLHHPPKLAQIHVHRVGDAIQPSHLPLSPSPPAFILSQHHWLFSSESVLLISWPKYWSFGFSISPSNEYSECEDNQSISKYILIFTNTPEALSGYVNHPEWEQLSCGLWSEFCPSPGTGTWTQPNVLFHILCSSQGSLQQQIIMMVKVLTLFKC